MIYVSYHRSSPEKWILCQNFYTREHNLKSVVVFVRGSFVMTVRREETLWGWWGGRSIVYHESIKAKTRSKYKTYIYECRCDERLKDKVEGSTRLTHTGWHGGLEHLKIETKLIDERFASVMDECDGWLWDRDARDLRASHTLGWSWNFVTGTPKQR